jgi:hypothetical protein
MEVYTVGEIVGEVVDCPIQTMLLRLVGSCGITLIAVTEVAATAIWRSDAPKLSAGGFGSPCSGCNGRGACSNNDVILNILTEDSGSVYCQTVSTSRDARDGNLAAAVDLAPVLTGLGVEVVVLEVPSVARQYCNRLRNASWKTDATRPSAATRGWKITRDVLCNRVVEISIPTRVGEATGIFAKVVD